MIQSPARHTKIGTVSGPSHPPSFIDHKRRGRFRAETLYHHIKLFGGSSELFDKSVEALQNLYAYSGELVPGETRTISDPPGLRMVAASTAMLTKTDNDSAGAFEKIAVPSTYMFPSGVERLLRSGAFILTEDNFVDFREARASADDSW